MMSRVRSSENGRGRRAGLPEFFFFFFLLRRAGRENSISIIQMRARGPQGSSLLYGVGAGKSTRARLVAFYGARTYLSGDYVTPRDCKIISVFWACARAYSRIDGCGIY